MNKIKQSLLSVVIGLALAAGVSYAWTGPTASPPAGNTDAPINVGTATQYKSGALGIGGLFRAYSQAIFDGNVGIGTASPGAKLEVNGNVKITDGTQGADKVLTSDANGNASWGAALSIKSWQDPSPLTSQNSNIHSNPSGGIKVFTIAHGFSTMPIFYKASFIKVAGPVERGYVVGDEIGTESCWETSTPGVPVTIYANSTSIGAVVSFDPTGTIAIECLNPEGGSISISPASNIWNWRLKITAIGR